MHISAVTMHLSKKSIPIEKKKKFTHISSNNFYKTYIKKIITKKKKKKSKYRVLEKSTIKSFSYA